MVGEFALELAAEAERGDLGLELAGEELEAAVHIEGLEQLLLYGRVLAKGEGGEIGEDLRVLDRLDEDRDVERGAGPELGLELEQAAELAAEALVL